MAWPGTLGGPCPSLRLAGEGGSSTLMTCLVNVLEVQQEVHRARDGTVEQLGSREEESKKTRVD